VVTATLRLTLDRGAPLVWTPHLEGPEGETGTAGGLRLVDEVNGREHVPLRDGEGRCLCSTGIDTPRSPGESVVVSAKFPAPPADVGHASLQVPGFASIGRVRIGA
jgi:hypothetical protein